MAKNSIFDTEAGFEEIRRRRDDIAREEGRASNPGSATPIPVPQPVQPAIDLNESDYWLGFEAFQKWGYKVDLGPIDPGLEAKMQAQHGIAAGYCSKSKWNPNSSTLAPLTDVDSKKINSEEIQGSR
jgi:hypothetical protein